MLDPSRVSYQWTLRQIGAYLDEHDAHLVTLVEVPEGFMVRFQRSPANHYEAVTFARHELVSLDVQQEEQRLKLQREPAAGDPAASLPPPQKPGGYQDFYRALGYELDQTLVYAIAVDELQFGVVITYLFVDPRHTFVPEKKMVFLKPEDKQTILDDAYARRQAAGTQQLTWGTSKIFT